MNCVRIAALATCLTAVAAVPAAAADYSSTIFFGDSLTDSGAFQSLLPVGGKFTTNPGPVWAETVAGRSAPPPPRRRRAAPTMRSAAHG